MIVYDNLSFLQTGQRFPSLSSHSKDMRINADGSVDVFFGLKAPWATKPIGCRRSRPRAGSSCDSTACCELGIWQPGEIEKQR